MCDKKHGREKVKEIKCQELNILTVLKQELEKPKETLLFCLWFGYCKGCQKNVVLAKIAGKQMPPNVRIKPCMSESTPTPVKMRRRQPEPAQ